MIVSRALALAIAAALATSLTGCGSTAAPTPTGPTAAASALQTALHTGDASQACHYIDEKALKAQIAKSGQAYAHQDCVTIMDNVLKAIQSSGKSIPELTSVTIVSQTPTTARLTAVDTDGGTSTSEWTLVNGTWKLTSSGVGK